MGYYEQKAKRAYEHYKKGIPMKNVYGAVEKDGKYLCLQHEGEGKDKYSIAGGGIDDGEDVVNAIKRELLEEMNIHVDFVKSLGHAYWTVPWEYKGKKFDVKYDAEVVLTRFVKFGDNKKLGLDGEFKPDMVGIAEISKEEMLKEVAEFARFGVKFED